jgi:hypothetical protein
VASASFAQLKEAKIDVAKPASAQVAAPAQAPVPKQSAIKWEKEMHDFGDIEKGKPVTYEFSFTNNKSISPANPNSLSNNLMFLSLSFFTLTGV